MAARVNQEQFEQEVLKSSIPVLADFYSDSCIPCKQLSPILGDLEEEYEDKIRVVKININFDGNLAAEYQVMAAPTVVFFKDGAEVDRTRGLVKKEELETIIKSLL